MSIQLFHYHIDNGQIVHKSDDGSELLLGLSREVAFVRDFIDIIKSEVYQLRTEIILPLRSNQRSLSLMTNLLVTSATLLNTTPNLQTLRRLSSLKSSFILDAKQS